MPQPKKSENRVISALRARTHFGDLLRRVENEGRSLVIEKRGTPRADYLVTGNTRHFPVFWKSTKIITSREFLGLVAPHLLG